MAFEAGYIALLLSLLTWNLVRSLRISIPERAQHHTQTNCLNMTEPTSVISPSLTQTLG